MSKLPTIYRQLFIREGVVARIHDIARKHELENSPHATATAAASESSSSNLTAIGVLPPPRGITTHSLSMRHALRAANSAARAPSGSGKSSASARMVELQRMQTALVAARRRERAAAAARGTSTSGSGKSSRSGAPPSDENDSKRESDFKQQAPSTGGRSASAATAVSAEGGSSSTSSARGGTSSRTRRRSTRLSSGSASARDDSRSSKKAKTASAAAKGRSGEGEVGGEDEVEVVVVRSLSRRFLDDHFPGYVPHGELSSLFGEWEDFIVRRVFPAQGGNGLDGVIYST